ncbi:MAG TPA: Hpt domain-containing protein [Thiobacillaceae bacterium]|nr:Hpt domain-containing protein [Thiobacillaceae bacterium]
MLDDIEFDLGPLSWVKGEVDNALGAARQALSGWDGAGSDALRQAAAHLHQVCGALQIVDLRGVSLLCAETERLLADMLDKEPLRKPESARVAGEAINALQGYLDELMAGAPNVELKLAAVHARVVQQRGAEPVAPSELFFPDMSPRARRGEPSLTLDDDTRNRAVHRARGQYQRGLLQVLQNRNPQAGLALMEQAVRQVEQVAPGEAQYTFWWSAAGLLEMLSSGALPADLWIKRLCGRIDMQMRRLMEGSRQLAERLLRDVLYYVSQDKADSGRAAEARALFELERYLPPSAEAEASREAWRPHLNALRDAANHARDHWLKYCSGKHDSLGPFQQSIFSMFEAAVRLPNKALQTLLRMVEAMAKRLPSVSDTAQNEALQLEMATALLLAQNAADHFETLDEEFERQVEVQTQRLHAALTPGYDLGSIPVVPMLDEMSRKAQEKLILAQVSQEILNNLHLVEEILDQFFRNAAERGRLPMVPGLLKQILGALNILQLDTAANLTKASLERISHFADPEYPISEAELHWVADALSTLGLYVEALRYGRDDPQQLNSLLERRKTLPTQETSVETQIRQHLVHLKGQATGEAAPDRGVLNDELKQLARDADLVGDAPLKERVAAVLGQIEFGVEDDVLRPAIAALSGDVEAASPTPEAARLVEESTDTIDREMLSVFIEEASQVLGTIAAQLARLHVSAYDNNAFTAVRRGFHTLKGSGRMVGLNDLADVAWEVEQTLNRWLRDERPPNADLLAFLEGTEEAFTGWVRQLEENGQARVEAEGIARQARALRGEGAGMAARTGGAPPPKAEAGARASTLSAGEEEAMMDIGGHQLPVPLFEIFTGEAAQRLADLDGLLPRIVRGHDAGAWEAFTRSAHTLAGICRTTGFQGMANAAHAVEAWAGIWPEKTAPLHADVQVALQGILAGLGDMLEAILSGRMPEDWSDLPDLLAGLGAPAAAEGTADAPAAAEPEPEPEAILEPEAYASGETPLPTVAAATAPPPAAPVPASVPEPADDLDPQLLPIFLEETGELLPQIGGNLRKWRAQPDSADIRHALQRALHTLKGSARMAGAMRLGELTHRVETRLIEHGDAPPGAEFLDSLEGDYDHLAEVIDRLKTGESEPVAPAVEEVPAEEFLAEETPAAESMPLEPQAPAAEIVSPALTDDELRLRQALKLKAGLLDNLINEAGEVAIARSRIQTVLSSYKQTAQELTANVERLRSQLRELEIQAETEIRAQLSHMDESHFDPLEFDRYTRLQELTRLLAESVNDVSTAQENLLSGMDEADQALVLQARMTRSLQQELMHLRMVPLNSLAERLHRVVRQTAKELGKKAQLEIRGGETELDRNVLDRLAAPLEHLLRNAVAHGIEAPEARRTRDKPEMGELGLSARQEGNEIIITFDDDGAGVDLERVRERAVALGMIAPDEAIGHERLEALLFAPGFTTAREVTEVAGRGIGLDVVKNELAGIGGRIRMETEAGRGTRFIIRLPLTLAVSQVTLVRVGGQVFALPANLVHLVREVRQQEFHELQQAGQVESDGLGYPLRYLGDLVDRRPEIGDNRFRTLLLLHAGDQRLALWVDMLEGNFEAVVKNVGPQIARIAGISGATVLGDGRIALILNPFALHEQVPVSPQEMEAMVGEEVLTPLVMVVDDSLTVRKITGRLLIREGFRVATAKDGIEALELLQEEVPAVMLLDIEMPRMDGFEVARHMRADGRTRDLPIIMITSRTADKHRQHALYLGVNAYLGKPYREEELLAEIRRLTQPQMAPA